MQSIRSQQVYDEEEEDIGLKEVISVTVVIGSFPASSFGGFPQRNIRKMQR